jgi:hypothetical protein
LSVVRVLCCQVEVSVTGRSLVQRNPTKCGVSECDPRISVMKRPRTTRAVKPWRVGSGGGGMKVGRSNGFDSSYIDMNPFE